MTSVLLTPVKMAEHVQMVSVATHVLVFWDTVASTAIQVGIVVFENYFLHKNQLLLLNVLFNVCFHVLLKLFLCDDNFNA